MLMLLLLIRRGIGHIVLRRGSKMMYIQPRPHSTLPNATLEHAREREACYATNAARHAHSTLVSLDQHSINRRSTRYYTTSVLYNETETCCFVCFCGCNRPMCNRPLPQRGRTGRPLYGYPLVARPHITRWLTSISRAEWLMAR